MNRHYYATIKDAHSTELWSRLHFTQVCEQQVLHYCQMLAHNAGHDQHTIDIEHS